MSRDWFRRSTWSEADRADFENRLRTARPGGRPQFLRVQGGQLAAAGLLTDGLGLLQRLIEQHPGTLDVTIAWHQIGLIQLRLGAVPAALDALAKAVASEARMPGLATDAWLDFGFTVARLGVTGRYAEALAMLEQRSGAGAVTSFPPQKFKLHTARAILGAERGLPGAAADAGLALQAAGRGITGLRAHPEIGLSREQYAELYQRLEQLARE